MLRVLAAPAAKLLLLDAVRRRFAVLHGRVVPLFALATLQRNDLSGHRSLTSVLTSLVHLLEYRLPSRTPSESELNDRRLPALPWPTDRDRHSPQRRPRRTETRPASGPPTLRPFFRPRSKGQPAFFR